MVVGLYRILGATSVRVCVIVSAAHTIGGAEDLAHSWTEIFLFRSTNPVYNRILCFLFLGDPYT